MKKYLDINVLDASKKRIEKAFDDFNKVYISFSGGKDSTVLLHLVMEEAIKRGRKVGLLIIDLEAQYSDTIDHINRCIDYYKNYIDLHWFCGELLLRNAVSNFQPRWVCWDKDKSDLWVREKPSRASDLSKYPFYVPKMEFEEFMVLFGKWYAADEKTIAFIGIRSDESLHRFKAITSLKKGITHKGWKWTTKLTNDLYNGYPLYDWKTEDVWVYLGKNNHLSSNEIYSKMSMAGVKISQQRLCQPYGDDQRRGLWLYQILEPDTWNRLLTRVSGVNSGALYIREKGNITGYNKIYKPDGHTWESYTNFILKTMPKKTQDHYKDKFKKFIAGWSKRGYNKIPDEAPLELESKSWCPSWRRMCKCLLRNDYWCKGLGFSQPKSEAYQKYKSIKIKRSKEKELIDKNIEKTNQLSLIN